MDVARVVDQLRSISQRANTRNGAVCCPVPVETIEEIADYLELIHQQKLDDVVMVDAASALDGRAAKVGQAYTDEDHEQDAHAAQLFRDILLRLRAAEASNKDLAARTEETRADAGFFRHQVHLLTRELGGYQPGAADLVRTYIQSMRTMAASHASLDHLMSRLSERQLVGDVALLEASRYLGRLPQRDGHGATEAAAVLAQVRAALGGSWREWTKHAIEMQTELEAERAGIDRYRHLKRGNSYRVRTVSGRVQTATALKDGDTVVVYTSDDTGDYWVRSPDEFFDGRFESLRADLPFFPPDPAEAAPRTQVQNFAPMGACK